MDGITPEVEQDINVMTEMNKIVFAGLTGVNELREKAKALCDMYDISTEGHSPKDVATEMAKLIVEHNDNEVTDEMFEERLESILAMIQKVHAPLSIPQL